MVPWTVGKGVRANGEPWEVRFDERGVLRGLASEERGGGAIPAEEPTWRMDYVRAVQRARKYQAGEPPWDALPPGWEVSDYRGVEELVPLAADPRTVRVGVDLRMGVWRVTGLVTPEAIHTEPHRRLGPEGHSKWWDAYEWYAAPGYRVARVAWSSREAARVELVVKPPAVIIRVHLAAPDSDPQLIVAVWEQPGALPALVRSPSTLRAAAPRKPPARRGRA